MSKPTCSSSTHDDDEPLLLDISTGKSVSASQPEPVAQPPASESSSESSSETPEAPRNMNLCDVIRMNVAERQKVLDEKVDAVAADMLFLFMQQIIPYTLAAPNHYKGLSFNLEDYYRVLYRIPSKDEADLSFNFTDANKTVVNKVDISKSVYSKLRQSLNSVRGMKCSRAIVKNEENVSGLPVSFDALVIDILKEGLTSLTEDDFKEPEEGQEPKLNDPVSVTIYLADKLREQIEKTTDDHVNTLYNAVLIEVVPHMIWQKDLFGENFVRETDDKWYVAVKLSANDDPETLRKYVVKIQTDKEQVLAEIDVSDEVYSKFTERISQVIGCKSSRETYEVDDKKIPVLALEIDKEVYAK